MKRKNLQSVRNWRELGILLALATITIGSSQSTLPVQAQEPPPNPCQSIIDEAVDQAKTGEVVDLVGFRNFLEECAVEKGIPIVESEVGGGDEEARAADLPGGVWPCLNPPLPGGTLIWIVIGFGTFTQPQFTGSSWHVATVQYESSRSSTLYSFAPGFGFSGPGTGLVRSVVAPFSPPPPPLDLLIIYVTWGAPVGNPPPFFPPPVYAVCMGMDRS